MGTRLPSSVVLLFVLLCAFSVRAFAQDREEEPEAKTGTTHRLKVKPIMPKATGVVSVGYAAPPPGSKDYVPFLLAVSRLWALSQDDFRPGEVQPVYFPPLDDPTTIALQAPLPPGKDAESVVQELDQRLQTALKPKIEPQNKLQLVNSMWLLGTADVPDAMWARNPYGLAFSLGRRHQLKIDGKELRGAIQRVTDADMQRLATSVFAAEKRIAVIVELGE